VTRIQINPSLRAASTAAIRWLTLRKAYELHPDCFITEYGQENYDTFFGYHDASPFGPHDQLLLAGRCGRAEPNPKVRVLLSDGYYNMKFHLHIA
jgi:hypothetical protein